MLQLFKYKYYTKLSEQSNVCVAVFSGFPSFTTGEAESPQHPKMNFLKQELDVKSMKFLLHRH